MTITPETTLTASVLAEIERLRSEGQLNLDTVEPRCWVCCEVESRDLVNKLLAAGLTNREITDACAGINSRRQAAGDDRIINARNVWQHRRAHFNLDDPAQAVYREIAERRAEEVSRDYINGIGHAVTPYAVLETAMVKGYKLVTDPNTEVNVREAMEAAIKLHEMTSRDAGQRRMADLMFEMERIISAIREVVPQQYHAEILARVQGKEISSKDNHFPAEGSPSIKEFTPAAPADEDDDL